MISAIKFIFIFILNLQLVYGWNIPIKSFRNQIKSIVPALIISSTFSFGGIANAGMLTFPLKYPMHNNILLLRAGESFADEKKIIETAPVKKLRQDNGLTANGRLQIAEISKKIKNFEPSYIWCSNTERAYESAALLAKVSL